MNMVMILLGKKHAFTRLLWLLGLCLLTLSGHSPISVAQDNPIPVTEVRTFYPSGRRSPHFSGLAYSAQTNQFYLIREQERSGEGSLGKLGIVMLSPYEELGELINLEGLKYDDMNLTFDNQTHRLLLYSHKSKILLEIDVTEQGIVNPTKITRTSLHQLGVKQFQGMALDASGQHLFILDSKAIRVMRIDADAKSGFAGTGAYSIDLAALGSQDLRGIAIHPTDHHLYLLSLDNQRLYKVTESGQPVATYDLTSLALNKPHGMVFAPSADRTDPADTIHLYITDRGRTDKKTYDRIIEVTLDAQVQVQSAAATNLSLFLVKTTDTSRTSPPSPDPSGLGYIPSTNRLFLSDGEVNEMPALFTGNNLYEFTLTGSLARLGASQPYSNEPTGVAYDTVSGHLFISDDDLRKVFELTAGPDGRFGSSDDTVTSFGTAAFNSYDPEGLAFDSANGVLYVVDGINNEVYRVHPGANGRFDGVPALGGDDVVTNFDLLNLGIVDPEGIEYDNNSGHLVILGRSDTQIYEVTTTGFLVRILSISDVNPEKLAGIAMAPGSQDPTVMNYYITDRGIDNDVDPTENDGKLYEFTLTASFGDLFISTRNSGTVGGVTHKDEDILSYDSATGKWALFFDGSDVNVTTDVDAFELLSDGSLLLSFEIETMVPSLGMVDDSDIVRFIPDSLGATTSGAFEWYFDGSDVGLTTDSDDIDAISVVNGKLYLSMLGDPRVPGVSGADEDILIFTPTQLGETTAGSWSFYFDGSDVGLSTTKDEDVQGASIDPATGDIYLSTKGAFAVSGVSGDGNDIFICSPNSLGDNTSCTFSFYWDGGANGLGSNTVDAFELADDEVRANAHWHYSYPITNDSDDEGESDSPESPDDEDEGEETYNLFLPLIRE